MRNGTDVVRLKIGDPYVFGRGSEEVLEFRRRLIEAYVVPGVLLSSHHHFSGAFL